MGKLIVNRGQYVYIKLSGEFNINDFRPGFPKLLQILHEVNVSKILIDCLELSGYFSRVHQFSINEWLATMNMSYLDKDHPPLKVAAVLNTALFDPGKFGETVARNRGLQCFHTTDMDEALAWLNIIPAETINPQAEILLAE